MASLSVFPILYKCTKGLTKEIVPPEEIADYISSLEVHCPKQKDEAIFLLTHLEQ